MTPFQAYKEEYSTKGSIEHGAHRVIEPQLIKEHGEDAPKLAERLGPVGEYDPEKD